MSNYANPNVLVDTQWLADNLNNPKIRIVEVDIDPTAYDSGHITGAVFWNGFNTITTTDMRVQLDRAILEDLLARSGITNNTTVIFYSDNKAGATFAFWYLKLFGHFDVRILNGGRKQWIAQGRSLTQEVPIITKTSYKALEPDLSLRVLSDRVKSAINNSDCILIDTRTSQEYDGELFFDRPPQAGEITGHIPSAIHIFYELAFNEDDTFKSSEELSTLYSNQNVTSNKEIIPYCAVGARSSCTWFVLKYLLGYPHVKNYDGSWNEWSRLPIA